MRVLHFKRLVFFWMMIALFAGCTNVTPTPALLLTQTPAATQTPTPAPTPTPTRPSTYWPTGDWRESTPEQQGMDSALLVKMFDFIEQKDVYIHSILIVRNGYVVMKVYFYPYQSDIEHQLASVTKSFTSALVGIAIKEGYIDGVDTKVLDFFPGRAVANNDSRKQAMALEHLLTMTAGLDWSERPYSSPDTPFAQMRQSPDWVQFFLDLPMAEEPATTFNYNTGGSHLLSAIVQEATGMSASSLAQTALFEPLGISDVSWPSDPNGVSYGGSGLSMLPRDMAKFGYLYLNDGIWEGEQIVPAEWVQASAAKHIDTFDVAPGYGFQWWVYRDSAYCATGSGGQYICVAPDQEMVVVFTGALENSDHNLPWLLVDMFILPAAKSTEPLPENPPAAASLEAKIHQVEQPEPQPAPPLPEMAQHVSGKTYLLEANPLNWHSFVLSFPGDKVLLEMSIEDDHLESLVGLDDVFRITEAKVGSLAQRGFWRNEETFIIDGQFLGGAERYEMRLTFEGNTVDVVWRSFVVGSFVRTSGTLQE